MCLSRGSRQELGHMKQARQRAHHIPLLPRAKAHNALRCQAFKTSNVVASHGFEHLTTTHWSVAFSPSVPSSISTMTAQNSSLRASSWVLVCQAHTSTAALGQGCLCCSRSLSPCVQQGTEHCRLQYQGQTSHWFLMSKVCPS